MMQVDQSVEAEVVTERTEENSEPSSFTKPSQPTSIPTQTKCCFRTQSNSPKSTEIMHNVPKIKEQTATSC